MSDFENLSLTNNKRFNILENIENGTYLVLDNISEETYTLTYELMDTLLNDAFTILKDDK
jgi:hypothetical protein